MNGVTATRELKKLLDTSCPPIVAMTAYSMKDDAEKFISEGLDDYISKPVKIADLYDRISKWYGHQVKGSSPAAGAPAAATPAFENLQLDMNVVEQLRSIGGDEFALQLYVDFEEETAELLAEARKEVAAQHYTGILSTLHQIKGTASTLGLDTVSTIAKELEHDILKGKLSLVSHTFSDLESSFTNFRANYRNKILSN